MTIDPARKLARDRRYYQEHKAEIAEQKRRYRVVKKAAIAAQRHRYYEEHKAEISAYKQRWAAARKEETSDRQRRWAYGGKVNDMWAAQGGLCANPGCQTVLAEDSRSPHVDHDHRHQPYCAGAKSCGECVRGLLCASCNVALGQMRDDPTRIRGLADYLEAHPTPPPNRPQLDLGI